MGMFKFIYVNWGVNVNTNLKPEKHIHSLLINIQATSPPLYHFDV